MKRLIEEFIAEVQKNDENEDLELKEGELSAVAGGHGSSPKYYWDGEHAMKG